MNIKKIAFFGATGTLGLPVAKELAKQGLEVVAMARNTAQALTLLPKNVEILQGDLQNTSDIERILEGADGIYLNLSVLQTSKEKDFQPERDGLKHILQVAKQANIKAIGYISSLIQRYQGTNGFNWWVFDLKQKAIQAIKESQVPSLIFYPSNFMDNFERGAYRQGNMIALAGDSKYPMYFVAAEDYARQVAQAFQKFTGESKEYIIQGLEKFIADEAAQVFLKNYTKEKIKIVKMPYGVLKFLGNFSQKFNYGAHIIKALNNYPEPFEAEKTWQELGNPQITLETYAKSL